jgi:general secretion pathway protein D
VQVGPLKPAWRSLAAAAAFLAAAAVPAVSAGASPQDPQQSAQSDAYVRFFQASYEPQEFVAACARVLGLALEGDVSKIPGPLSFDTERSYSKQEVWELFHQELAVRGFSTVLPPGSDTLRLVPLADAASVARLEPADPRASPAGFQRVIYPLRFRKPETAADAVRPFLSKPAGTVTPLAEGQGLVISDLRWHLDQARTLLNRLDGPADEPVLEEIPLTHLSPAGMSALAERVNNARKLVTGEPPRGALLPLADSRSLLVVAPVEEIAWWKDLVARFDRAEPATTVEYRPRRFGLRETSKLIDSVVHGDPEPESHKLWRMVEDELTGTLFVTTTPSRHEEIRALLARLESVSDAGRKPLRAFPIKNRRVSEVLVLLRELLNAGVLDRAAGGREPGTQEPSPLGTNLAALPAPADAPLALGSSAQLASGSVELAADEATSRILAFGEAPLLDQLGRLIAELDVRPAQVIVEALMVSLSESESRDLGVEIQKLGSNDGNLFHLASLFDLGSTAPNANALVPPTGSGFGGAVLDPGSFSALVSALDVVSKGRTVTLPKVLVANNQEASLQSVQQVPYSATNASDTVATTSFGGTLDAGTSILVKPQLGEGDQILLDYSVSLSTFTGEATNPNLPPPRQQNELKSTVAIPDGHTVVIGGLEIQRESEGSSQVPWLGDLPLLGSLFRSRGTEDSRSRFFVFLRCSVLRADSFEDLRWSSRPDLAAAGIPDGWPKLAPRVMR